MSVTSTRIGPERFTTSSASSPSLAVNTLYPADFINSAANSRTASSSSTISTAPEWCVPFLGVLSADAASSVSCTTGKYTSNRVLSPGPASTQTPPPLCFTTPYTVANPNPVPLPNSLVVKNGSKILSFVSASIPCPLSSTVSRM